MIQQFICMMVKNWIKLDKIQFWILDLKAIASFTILKKFLSVYYIFRKQDEVY